MYDYAYEFKDNEVKYSTETLSRRWCGRFEEIFNPFH
jgi:hypothetical protein